MMIHLFRRMKETKTDLTKSSNRNLKPKEQDHTFLFFFIFEGGHRPFFLKWRFLTSLFLRSLIFLANFIFIFWSSFTWSFDSNGSSSTGKLSSLVSGGGGGLVLSGSAPSISEVAFKIIAPLCFNPWIFRPLKTSVCRWTDFLETNKCQKFYSL